MIKTHIAVVLIMFFSAASAQQMRLEVIDLNHRLPDDVITVIRPMLVPGGSISGSGDKIIVKTTPANLRDIHNILAAIDKPARRLMISVTQGINSSSGSSQRSYSGRVGNEQFSIESGIPDDADTPDNRIEYRAVDRYSTNNTRGGYTIQALEGEPAFINSGTSVPIVTQTIQNTPNGTIIQNTREYRDVSSGFYVLPRLNGDRVTLMISSHLSSLNGAQRPAFNIQNVQTTVTGRLGEWLEIGGISQVSRSSSSSTFNSGNNQIQESRPVLIKVEEIR
jgi:type II secretory pathway component GspD/PulD (secretin)